MKTQLRFILITSLISTWMAACGPSQAEQQATVTQIAANVYSTQTAQAPTATATFTPSPIPTETASPTGTPTPSPFACTDPISCVTVAPGEPVHIAYALVTSGRDGDLGTDSRNGAEIAISDKGGQILGHEILFDGTDDGCSPDGGQAAGLALAADPSIIAILGTSCSSALRVAMPFWSKAGFTVVSPSNTPPDLTQAGNQNNHPGYLRTSHNDAVQGTAAAHFAREILGVEKAATLHDGSVYASNLKQSFADEFVKLGGTITAQEEIASSQTDMSEVLTRLAAGSPELIYFPVFVPAGTQVIIQARQTPGLENITLMSADGMFSREVVQRAGDTVEGVFISSPDLTQFSPDYESSFVPAYRDKYGSAPISIFHAHAYDAMNMIFACIEKVAIQDGDGTIHIGRQALRDCMYATTNFPGLTGNLTCTPTGDCADPTIAVYEFHAGEYPPEKVWSANP